MRCRRMTDWPAPKESLRSTARYHAPYLQHGTAFGDWPFPDVFGNTEIGRRCICHETALSNTYRQERHLTRIAAKPAACLVCRRLYVPNRQRSLDMRWNMSLTFIDLIGACLFGTSRDASRHKGKRVSEDSDCVDRSGNETARRLPVCDCRCHWNGRQLSEFASADASRLP